MWLWLGRTDNILELWHPHHKFRDIRLKYKLFYCVTMFFFHWVTFSKKSVWLRILLSESTLLRSGVMISDFFSVFIIRFYNTVSDPPLLLLSKFNVNDLIPCPKLEIWLFSSAYKNSGFNFESFVKWSPFQLFLIVESGYPWKVNFLTSSHIVSCLQYAYVTLTDLHLSSLHLVRHSTPHSNSSNEEIIEKEQTWDHNTDFNNIIVKSMFDTPRPIRFFLFIPIIKGLLGLTLACPASLYPIRGPWGAWQADRSV